jgi:diketogulonate reductase-like aldo/keto reductase
MYNLSDRGIEWDLYPKCRNDRIAIMAYCPLGQGRLTNGPGIELVAKKHRVTPAAIALAFTLRLPGVISIPKSSSEKRVLENSVAADGVLDDEDLATLRSSFSTTTEKASSCDYVNPDDLQSHDKVTSEIAPALSQRDCSSELYLGRVSAARDGSGPGI